MNIIKYSWARQNLKKVIDDVSNSEIPTCIISKGSQVVIISKDKYFDMLELMDGTGDDK